MADINALANFEQWKILRAKTNWKIKEERYDLLEKLYPSIKDWNFLLSNRLRGVFRPAEIECLLRDSLNLWIGNPVGEKMAERFTGFVVRTGYKLKPKIDEDGKPQLHRTTPVHRVARRSRGRNNQIIVLDLLKIYDSNYIDNFGFGHFHVACMYGCQELVEKFLELGQDPDCVDPVTGRSPLLLAAVDNNEHLFEPLLRHGADPNLANEYGRTVLHVICARANNGVAEAARLFVEVAIDKLHLAVRLNATDKSDDTPLHLALKQHPNKDAVDLLLRKGGNPNLANAEGSTALHILCEHCDDRELLRTILESCDDAYKPVQLDARDKSGDTPLHLALNYGHKRLVEALLRSGADPSLANEKGAATPLHILCEEKYDDGFATLFFESLGDRAVRLDARNEAGDAPLHLALKRGRRVLARLLMKGGADPNARDAQGATPLHILCEKVVEPGEEPFVHFFMYCEERANINAQDVLGNTPLHAIVQRGENSFCYCTIDFLLIRGADPTRPNIEGRTPLHIMCGQNFHHRKIESLLRFCDRVHRRLDIDARDRHAWPTRCCRETNPNLANEKGLTPLHLALKKKDKDLLVAMLRKGGDPNLANNDGSTALHLACSSRGRDGELAEVLLGDQPPLRNIDARDARARTLLQLAAANFMPLTLAAILERGASVSRDFVFPTESCFGQGVPRQFTENRSMKKLRLAASAMVIVESLEARGYEFYRSDALRIMRFFADHQLLESPSSDIVQLWRDDEDFASKTKGVVARKADPVQTLGDLIPLPARETVKRLTVVRSARLPLGSRVRIRCSLEQTRGRLYRASVRESLEEVLPRMGPGSLRAADAPSTADPLLRDDPR
ncbi:unnamed protein product [Trichogramma brassicae]|uniref:Uncharacterized protein n=1 Tax=Trichogramma brassicae TaxID=86971 RepID=A0A6H5IGM4_9HYME|nr:unnamed protein product [Trichogramma brassicae]